MTNTRKETITGIRVARGMLAVAAILAAASFLASCGAAAKSAPAEMYSKVMEAEASDSAAYGSMDSASLTPSPSAAQSAARPAVSRKRIVTGTLELQVADLSASIAAIGPDAAALGGYVSSSQIEPSWAQFVVRIPTAGYDRILSRLSSRGKVLRSFSQIEDVTEQWFDLDGRVRSKRILLERYLAYLRQAKNVEELMQIERQVNDVTTEIEQLEGSFRLLENQIEYSTLTVTLSLPGSSDSRGYDLGGALVDFGGNVADFFMRFLIFILYFLAIGIPVVFFLALVWLLLFGRIGLARRLFALVSGSHAAQKPKN